MKHYLPIFAAALALSGTAAGAQSLKLREMFASDRAKVAEEAKEASDACGGPIAFQMNYATYSGVLDDVNNQSPWAYAANVSDALKRVCASDEGKAAVRAKIRSVTVAHGDRESISLSNGVLAYAVPYSGHSPATIVRWLQDNL